jgi:phospholipid transport system substrate-binding protein
MKGKVLVLSCLLFFCFSLVLLPARASAGEPTDMVKKTVDAVLDILKNKELKKPGKAAERRAEIRKTVSQRFDFAEMAKRSLAQNWRKRTPGERKEFVQLFTDLLENAYINKIEKYQDEKIYYTGEKVEGTYATVKTNVQTSKGTETPIEYRLMREGNQWMAYDVLIEGVSLVNNYRNQFNSIIRSDSYDALVKRLKEKTIKSPK